MVLPTVINGLPHTLHSSAVLLTLPWHCSQDLDLAKTKIWFGGAKLTPEELTTQLALAVHNKKEILLCHSSNLNIVKTMLLGRELPGDVWMWGEQVLISREKFCEAANAALQVMLDCVLVALKVSVALSCP